MEDHFVRIAEVGNLASAELAAARLRSEGIEVRLHGEGMGPYPMTVGQLAVVEIWVLASQLENADRTLMEMDLETMLHRGERPPPLDVGDVGRRVFAVVTAVALLIAVVWTAMRVF